MNAIEGKDIVKKYKNGIMALNGLSLSVKSGEIFSLLGQNGAGKSTLIKILSTYLKPSSGSITMFGKDLNTCSEELRFKLACVSQQISIDTHLSLEENMLFQSKLYKIPREKAFARMEDLIESFELEQYRKYPVSSYSGGIKRRLDIALNMMSDPKILFLDEPTVGMDIQSRMKMWTMMRKIRDDFGTTIFLTTHYLEEADNLSNTVCIMKDGQDIIQGTPSELRSFLRQNNLKIVFANKKDMEIHMLSLKEAFSGRSFFARNGSIIISAKDKHVDMQKAIKFLSDHAIACDSVQIIEPSMEDIFLKLTTKTDSENFL